MPTNFSIASLEAAQYLKLPMIDFVNYVNQGLICYQLLGKDKVFTRNELRRFNNEVLEQRKKL